MPAQDNRARKPNQRRGEGEIRRVPPGTFRAEPPGASRPHPDRDASDRPALVMVLAPVLGLSVWGAILYLLLA